MSLIKYFHAASSFKNDEKNEKDGDSTKDSKEDNTRFIIHSSFFNKYFIICILTYYIIYTYIFNLLLS